ncbi:DUF3781 domain-containing protein [Methanorbis rubei]|uniref:DUF3781 domain-containing protein n=1 Tax=Methanorbis rubei TaxID=3028300 RepID=A0AAE4MHP0_9EURY|nr:hypothetical protein [Methanocorpusculaceae archaeon Cs1]
MGVETAASEELIAGLSKLHTTKLGAERIRRNLSLESEDDVVGWCREQITNPDVKISRKGKNFYVYLDGCEITIHARSCSIITAHVVFKRE